MDIHPTDFIWYFINIAVLFFLLRLLLWKPLRRFLDAREQGIKDALDNAQQTQKDAQALKSEYQESLDSLETKGHEILRDSHSQAEDEAKEIIAEAKVQADALLDDARVKIESEKAIAVARARDDVAQLATDLASRILKREVNPADSAAAADDFFSEKRS